MAAGNEQINPRLKKYHGHLVRYVTPHKHLQPTPTCTSQNFIGFIINTAQVWYSFRISNLLNETSRPSPHDLEVWNGILTRHLMLQARYKLEV